jgi:hypothetical protein
MESNYIDWYEQNEEDKPIIKQIENIIEEEKSYYSTDMILKELFNIFNIKREDIKQLVKSERMKKEKCKICTFYTEYTYNKHILRCNLCNHINFCDECYSIVKFDWINKLSRCNDTNKIINCKICNEKLNIDVCKICENNKCIGQC